MNSPGKLTAVLVMIGSLCSAAEQRVWNDATGAFSVEAEFVDSSDGHVRLRKGDGTVIRIRISELSAEDQALIRKRSSKPETTAADTGGSSPGKRVWKDATGEFAISAGLVGVSGGKVRLRKADGSVIEVPLDKLSIEDRKYLKKTPGRTPVSTETILEQNASVDIKDVSLKDVIKQLGAEYHIPIVIDHGSLDDVGVGAGTPVTCTAVDKPLKQILGEMLDRLDLVYRVELELVVITTPEANKAHQTACVYQITRGGRWNDFDAAIQQIRQEISPNGWDSVGGPATIKSFMLDGLPLLIVSHNYSAQREIADQYEGSLELARLSTPLSGKDLGIPEEMLQSCAWSLESVPLGDFVTFLHNSHDLDVELDEAALRDYGLTAALPLNAKISGMTVLNAMTYVLSQQDLVWTIQRKDNIVITIPEQAETSLFTKTYPVGDLIGRDPTGRASDNLIDVITSIVSPARWRPVGGKGTIVSDRRRTITVSQTTPIHLQIADLLAHIRAVRRR